MSSQGELLAIKRRVSPRLLVLDGVAGVGLRAGTLAIYLVRDADFIRTAVQRVLEREAPGVEFKVLVSGRFEKG